MEQNSNPARAISARELDCLRLVATGASSREVAWSLGAAVSTVEKHLASVRRKLGVKRTAQAVAYFWTVDQQQISNTFSIDRHFNQTCPSIAESQFIDDISRARSFDTASIILNNYLSSIGFDRHILGLVAEPAGQCTTGARLLGTSYPKELMELYRKCGGEATDPIPRRIAGCLEPFQVDLLDVIKDQVGPEFQQLRVFGSALADLNLRQIAVIPSADFATGIPISLTVGVRPNFAAEFRNNREQLEQQLRQALDVFWMAVRREKLIAAMSALTLRQRQALSYCARGFTVDQMADQMGVSTRSVDKLLSNARRHLGVKTTSAAVFRAVVYGAI